MSDNNPYFGHATFRKVTGRNNLMKHVSLKAERADKNLNASSIDSRLADLHTTGIPKIQRRWTDTGDSTASHEAQDESGRSDVSTNPDSGQVTPEATLPRTTYSASSSQSSKGKDKGIDYSVTSRYDMKRKTERPGVYSTLRKRRGFDHRMFFYDIEKYTAERMHHEIDCATVALDNMATQFGDVMVLLEDHTDWTYYMAVEKTTLDNIDAIRSTCEWIRETLEELESEKTLASQASSLKGP